LRRLPAQTTPKQGAKQRLQEYLADHDDLLCAAGVHKAAS
jgi:hypothetical protein